MIFQALLAAAFVAAAPADSPLRADGTALLHPNDAFRLSFKSVKITPAKDNGGRPFYLAMTQADLSTAHTSPKDLIRFAYHAKSFDQIVGGPTWIDSAFYDVKAEWPDVESLTAAADRLPADQRPEIARFLMQSLLANRLQLKAHVETRTLPVYALVVASNSPRLSPSKSTTASLLTSANGVDAKAETMHTLADFLSISDELGGHLVLDETGLKGTYDFTIDGVSMTHARNPSTTSIFTAIRNQLGLKLELRQATDVEILVIDHAEPPSTN